MGKAQKKKAMRRHNPVRVPDTHLPQGLAVASSSSSKQEALLPIISKLGAIDATERIWACAAVSTLTYNDPATRRLLQGKNIVGELITRLSDAVEEVIVEAVGALRNLCIDGGHDICAEMYNKNILAPLRLFPSKISAAVQQLIDDPKATSELNQRLVSDFAENVITIFWCLAETSNKALNAVNELDLIPFLISFLSTRDKLSQSTVNAAAQCLYVLTEDNDVAIEVFRNDATRISILIEIAQTEPPAPTSSNDIKAIRWTTLSCLASGILKNIAPLPTIMPTSSIDLEKSVIMPRLLPQLSYDLCAISDKVTQLLSQLPDTDIRKIKPSLQHVPRSDHKLPAEQELGCIEETLRLVNLTLEILTGICAKLPDELLHLKEDEVTENVEDADMEDGNIDDVPEEPEDETVTAPRDSTNNLISILTSPLVKLITPTTLSFPPAPHEPSPHPPTTAFLSSIHIRALECLNNLFLAIDENDDASQAGGLTDADRQEANVIWTAVWKALAQIGKVVTDGKFSTTGGFVKKKEMWEIAMGVLWGIARIGRRHVAPDPEQIQIIMEFCDASSDDAVRVKCIGALECLAQFPNAIDGNRAIAEYLHGRITSPSPTTIESSLQAVSAIIDIYSDENMPYDINFRNDGWVSRLEQILPATRKLIRGIDRRKPGGMALRSRGDGIVVNLAAFIKYRKGLGI